MSDQISDKDNEPGTGGELLEVPIRTVAGSSSSTQEEKEAEEGRRDEPPSEPRQGDEQATSGFDYDIAATAAIVPVPITTWWTSRPPTSRAFYTKAAEHNESLTRLERLYLRSRLDLPGKALSCPDEITPDEADQLLGRPPPAILNKNLGMFSYEESSSSSSSSSPGDKRTVQPKTIHEVVEAYHISNKARIKDLSFDALECAVSGWWNYSQAVLLHPWERECWDDGRSQEREREVGTCAASDLLCKGKKEEEEEEFRQKVLELWLARQDEGEMSTDMENALEGIEGEDEEGEEEVNKRLQGLIYQANKLREEMLVEVRVELEGLSEEEKKVMEELREREIRAIALEPEEINEEKKRKKEEDDDEKRRKRAKKQRDLEGADGDHVGADEEDDSEGGYDIFLLPV